MPHYLVDKYHTLSKQIHGWMTLRAPPKFAEEVLAKVQNTVEKQHKIKAVSACKNAASFHANAKRRGLLASPPTLKENSKMVSAVFPIGME